MKVKAKDNFRTLRNIVIGLDKKDYRALQAGKTVDVKPEIFEKFEKFLERDDKIKVVKDGD